MINQHAADDPFCQGIEFEVTDVDALAHAIALVLVQEYQLARNVIVDPDSQAHAPVQDANIVEDIIGRRLEPTVNYHRDGLLFQLMMWLAANLDAEEGDLIALPHVQAAAKGQDSFIVHHSEDAVHALTICEDKATENPRDSVRELVWPEIRAYEAGARRDELRSGIITVLGMGGFSQSESIAMVRRIAWEEARRYRVRVTVEGKRSIELFKGFDEAVEGPKERRRGETARLPGLRAWMNDLAEKTKVALRQMAAEDDSDV